jgi:hypothetical protein
MGYFRYRRRIKVAPAVFYNVGKKGSSLERLRALKTFHSADAVNHRPSVAEVHSRRFRLSGQTLETGLPDDGPLSPSAAE